MCNKTFEKNRNTPQNGGVCFILSEADLRSVVKEMYHEEQLRVKRAIEAQKERATITRQEASRMLNVTLSTLWRWNKDGYLTPVKIGSKVLYRTSDIEQMLMKMGKGVTA